jgi:CubicO group peptidase (beta-lactamase class C family)
MTRCAFQKGIWSGVLEDGPRRLRLKLVIDQGAETASLFSLDRRVETHRGRMTSAGSRIDINFPTLQAVLSARKLDADRIEGVWCRGGFNLPLTFNRGAAAAAAPPPARPLTSERLAELRVQAELPVLAAASARRLDAARVWVAGERAVRPTVPISERDPWHLGSIGKSMTATLVARLVDLGAVGWDDTVDEVLQAVVPDMNDAFRAATLRHLLSHRSGLPANISQDHLDRLSRDIARARGERRAYIRQALAMETTGPPGATFEYSNSGYVVAAAMLEAKLDQSWESLMQTHLFEPLKLRTAGFGAPDRSSMADQSAAADAAMHPDAGEADIPAVLGPAGHVHMSLHDLLAYLVAHRERVPFLRPQTWATLHAPPFGGDYALGWVVRSNGALWHSGCSTFSYVEALIDGAVVAAAAANNGDVVKSAPAVRRALLDAAAAVVAA